MKKTIAIAIAMTLATGISFARTYSIDTGKSKVEWFGSKVTGKHDGTIKVKEGKIKKSGSDYSGEVVIDMTSILVKDIKDPDTNAKLTGHLKSDDFFNVEKYPESKLVIESARKVSGNKYEISGKLTIRDKTNAVKFPAVIRFKGKRFTATGKVTIDRAKYNVKYGSGSFFKGLGDKLIHDNFDLKFSIKGK